MKHFSVLLISAIFLALTFSAPVCVPQSYAQETKILRLAAIQPLDSDLTQACMHFAKLAGERTQGRVKIEVYPAGQLFSDKDLTKALPTGAVDFAQVTTGVWTGLVPALAVIELPFFFQNDDHVARTFSDLVFRKTLDDELAKKGVKLMFRQTMGYSFGYASIKPIRTIEDFKGKRMRAHGEMPAAIIKALGGSPLFIGTGDVYLGYQRGLLDGSNTSPCFAWDKKYYEVIRNYAHLPSSDLMSPPLMLASLKSWNALPPDIQKILTAVAKETEAYSLKLSDDRSRQCARNLETKKVTIYNVPDAERQRWAKACMPIHQEYLDRNGEVGKKLYTEVEKNRKK
jgi:TRAP-type C4-dicarboxylate transport system substrate-binding protein